MNVSRHPRPVAIVTGSSRGIGAAIAQRLATDGHAVVVNYAGPREEADDVVARIAFGGGQAVALQADVADPDAVRRLFDATRSRFGGVDVLVNNASVMDLAPVAGSDDGVSRRTVYVDFRGSFTAMREAARRLRDGGRIVNLSTSVAGVKLATYGVYAATNAGVELLTAILSKELRGRPITVNAVAPGPTRATLFRDGKPPGAIARMARMGPLERPGTPDDVASVVSFLASAQGGWIHGRTVRANGGMA